MRGGELYLISEGDIGPFFGILQIFFNSGLLVYLGVIKNGKDKGE